MKSQNSIDAHSAGSTQVDQPPKQRWWRRKRVWIPALVLILLAIIGIVVGAVLGVKKSNSEDVKSSDRDKLFAGQGQSSAPYPTPTSVFGNTTATVSYTPVPSSSPTTVLRAPGWVPHDLSAAVGGSSLLFWDLRPEGQLFRREGEGPWEAYPDRQFLLAPIAVRTGEKTQTAISIDAVHGTVLVSHYHDGQWAEWYELDFARRFASHPTVISRAQDRLDVFCVDYEAHIWHVSFDGLSWSEWTELGDGTNGFIAATSWGEDRMDLFAKYGDTTNAPLRHKYWTAGTGWAGKWEDLGLPVERGYDSSPRQTGPERVSSPFVVSWCESTGDCKIDVVINAGSTYHKLFQNGAWDDWAIVPASHEGLEFPDTQSITRGDGVDGRPFAHLVSRGTDTCIHHIAHNGTAWVSWTFIWCEDGGTSDYPTQFLPTFVGSADGANIEVLARDISGDLHKLGFFGMPDASVSYQDRNAQWTNLGHG